MDAGTIELTELEKLEVTRVDAVSRPANGFPVLIMKGIAEPAAKGARDCPKCDKSYDADHQGSTCENCGTDLPDAPAEKAAFDHAAVLALVKAIVGRKVDEGPDIAGGNAVLSQLADLIIAEAQELKAGNTGEIADIQQLACAAEMIWCWRTGEESAAAGSVMQATALMQSAAEGRAEPRVYTGRIGAVDGVAKDRNYSAAERKEMAGDGRALPDGSYPINDEHDLNSAAILARSGHGDVAAAKKHIARRAAELKLPNPLDNDQDGATKAVIAPGGTTVDTETQDDGQIAKAVEALAKVDALEGRIKAAEERAAKAEEQVAKWAAMPRDGGPMMTRVQAPPRAEDAEDHAAKAMQYDMTAEQLADQGVADAYRKLAAQHRAKITV